MPLKTINITISALCEVLFFTVTWILVYTNTIDYLRFTYHPEIKEIIYQSPLANPEPYEIPLYLLLTLVFIFLIWLYSSHLKNLQKIWLNTPLLIKILSFIILLATFFSKLGSFPLLGDFGYSLQQGHLYPNRLLADKSLYMIIFVLVIGFMLFITIQSALLSKILKDKQLLFWIINFAALIIAAIATFEPGFPLAYLDSSFFFGPVWEITNGKTIFTDIPSQYGFLSILFFSLVHKATSLNFVYLSIFIWVAYIIEYFICFYLVLKVGRSVPLAFVCLFSLLIINYYALYHNPQGGPLRWLPLFIALLLFYRLTNRLSFRFNFLIVILSMWIIDSGIALIFAFGLTLAVLWVSKRINLIEIIVSCLKLLSIFISVLLFLQLTHLLLGMKLIDFGSFLHTLQKNAGLGLVMIPIEYRTHFWLFILVYFASVIYFFKAKVAEQTVGKIKKSEDTYFELFKEPMSLEGSSSKREIRYQAFQDIHSQQNLTQLLLFSANLMLFASIYYVGRSMPHNLYLISPFFCLTLFLLFALHYPQLKSERLKKIFLGFVFLVTIVYPGYFRKENMVNELLIKYQKLRRGGIFTSEFDRTLYQRYSKELALIKSELIEDEVLLLTTDDTYLLYLAGKKNLLDINSSIGIILESELNPAIKRALEICPQKIAVDCQIINKCPAYKPLVQAFPRVLPIILNKIESVCKIKYEPSTCTRQICLVDAKRKNQ
ncbi:hypothetical protein A2774_05105 [Candidatus Roizmanbacteria bacterium RIFCSPHIGHO2_01_FULL_39_12c]|uniref:Uncharacterized protein n=1 Tax=Candidatus Roizmanbacteria bacterium RIFCSPHIGHO2_01_FULL_39_12c TaxID=1802031 RepID=A0A1F7GF29_9BACT|nr:MAG: hypothetical protein A2774_05105 [Candidatus Roizmanbacteria bacterium RIFCSPHIGHO2_01_FULL_39_12c]OGK48140.1 MAG: hypothetical protein A2963_04305 [Candidatus Roizmanbacteria bacterium RIFCSPLOWO2_01_FULL_40_13]